MTGSARCGTSRCRLRSSGLRQRWRCESAFSRHETARVMHRRCPRKTEGAGNTGCCRTREPCVQKNVCTLRTQATTGQPKQPAVPRQWVDGLYVVSSVAPGFCHRRLMFVTRGLIPASGDRDRTIRRTQSALRRLRAPRPSQPASRFVTIGRKRPSCRDGLRRTLFSDLPIYASRKTRQSNTTGNLRMADMCGLPVVLILHSAARQHGHCIPVLAEAQRRAIIHASAGLDGVMVRLFSSKSLLQTPDGNAPVPRAWPPSIARIAGVPRRRRHCVPAASAPGSCFAHLLAVGSCSSVEYSARIFSVRSAAGAPRGRGRRHSQGDRKRHCIDRCAPAAAAGPIPDRPICKSGARRDGRRCAPIQRSSARAPQRQNPAPTRRKSASGSAIIKALQVWFIAANCLAW